MSNNHPNRKGGRRSAARLAVVQALYEMEVAGRGMNAVLTECLAGDWRQRLVDPSDVDVEGLDPAAEPDREMVSALLRVVSEQEADLGKRIDPVLKEGQTLDRLETLIRCILLAGLAELMTHSETDRAIIIDEYVEVARAFYEGPEIGLVNAVLDRLAGEMAAWVPLQAQAPGA